MQKHNTKERNQEWYENLILSNADLVHSIAHKYTVSERYSYDDLFQQGMVGLMNAANTFDDNRGVKFATYAYRVVENSILDFIYSNVSPISFPKSAGRNYLKSAQNEHCPDDKIATAKAPKMQACHVISLDADHDEVCLADMIMDPSPLPEDMYINSEITDEINRALLRLAPADRKLIQSYFGLRANRKTLSALAKEYGISRQAVSDRLRVVCNKLKPMLEKTR